MSWQRILLTLFVVMMLVQRNPTATPPASQKEDSISTPNKRKELSGPKVTCPVCGLAFCREEAVKKTVYKGKVYFFYIEDHFNAFSTAPSNYLLP